MKLKLVLTLLMNFFAFHFLYSCFCIGPQTFCESTIEYPNIAIVKVINVNSEYGSFDVEVEEMITGSLTEKFISINYSFNSCSSYYDAEVGKRIMINFNKLSDSSDSTYPGYSFFSCAVNFLKIEGTNILGPIKDKKEELISIDDFLDSISECIDLSFVNPANSFFARFIRVINNPTTGRFEITPFFYGDEIIKVSIIDAQGKLIKNYSFSEHSNNYEFDISHYSRGLYFCKINYRGLSIMKKILKI